MKKANDSPSTKSGDAADAGEARHPRVSRPPRGWDVGQLKTTLDREMGRLPTVAEWATNRTLVGLQDVDRVVERVCAEFRSTLNILEGVRVSEAASRVPSPPAWQPIDTAPKDGTKVLVVFGLRPDIAVAFGNRWGEWMEPGGLVLANPTHWMPLPKGPGPETSALPSPPDPARPATEEVDR